jgi:hypothetical protein
MVNPANAPFKRGYVLPVLERAEVVDFLAALATETAACVDTGLLFHIDTRTKALRPFLPHWTAAGGAEKDRVLALRSHVATVLEGMGQPRDLSRIAAQSQPVEGLVGIASALVFGIRQAAIEDPRTARGPQRVALFGDNDTVADLSAQVVRRSRSAAMSVLANGPEETVVILSLPADQDGATLDGLRAASTESTVFLAEIVTSTGSVWLPETISVSMDRRPQVAAMLSGLRTAGALAETDALLVFDGPDGAIKWLASPTDPAFEDAAETAAEALPQTGLRVQRLDAVASPGAIADLRRRIVATEFPLGYRVQLDHIDDRTALERNVELLREEIAEREAEIELIRALAAPQLRLLRFTDAQLPALVDAFRQLPNTVFESADLRYAAAHASGRSDPAHFLLYDPSQVALDGAVREHIWRGRTEDHPIRYWLDPHAAQAMDRDRTRLHVFVPHGTRLIPNIDGFGGRLSDTVKLILGNLFSDAAQVLEAKGAEPIFLFSATTVAGADMDVELLDRRWFEPLSVSVKWINDYMMVRSPRLVDRATLSRLAEDLYEGQVAQQLHQKTEAAKASLSDAWSKAETDLRLEIETAVAHVAAELDRSTERMALGRAFLADAENRIDRLDTLVGIMRDRLQNTVSAISQLDDLSDQLAADRYDMVADMMAEIALGDTAMERAMAEVDAQREKLDALIARIQR